MIYELVSNVTYEFCPNSLVNEIVPIIGLSSKMAGIKDEIFMCIREDLRQCVSEFVSDLREDSHEALRSLRELVDRLAARLGETPAPGRPRPGTKCITRSQEVAHSLKRIQVLMPRSVGARRELPGEVADDGESTASATPPKERVPNTAKMKDKIHAHDPVY